MSDIANHYKKHYTEFFSATITYIFFTIAIISLVFVEASCKVGQWIAVIFKKEWYVGDVCSVEDDMIQVKCMKRTEGNLNKFA